MSYLDYPRIHFSGTFSANPSTINNTPNNYNPLVYPTPDELERVELYWNARGDGGFSLMEDCLIRQVDYADGSSATTAGEDPIIGQAVKAVFSKSFPLQAAMVDLDPMQQNVSEIWAMVLQIGNDDHNLQGKVSPVAFNGIWAQCQGPNAPHSSASGSAVFQTKMTGIKQTGNANGSKFLQYFIDHPTTCLSLNFNTNGHNNAPPIYRFDTYTFITMEEAGVPASVLAKLAPMKKLFQNAKAVTVGGKTVEVPADPGDVPTKKFVKYMLQQYLTIGEFNANIDTILKETAVEYQGSTSYDFLFGMIAGTVGPANEEDPTYFVPSRILCPPSDDATAFYAPFQLDDTGTLTLNLGNSLPTKIPGNHIYQEELGTLWLVAFPDGEISLQKANKLIQIPYESTEFLADQAGFFTCRLKGDYRSTPLGILSSIHTSSSDPFKISESSTEAILLAENTEGYFLRADQFVYRMNPGMPTTNQFPRGKTNTVHIHALKFGKPVSDGTEIALTMMTQKEAEDYTVATLGTSGTLGVKNLSIPREALTFPATAVTKNGIATFDLSCKAPGNPRHYVDGQVYFLNYNFVKHTVTKDLNDLVSVLVYDQEVEDDAQTVLAKFGRLYKVMGFLADEEKVKQLDLRNMVKVLLQKPYSDLVHMPVTRDLSESARKKIIEWIDVLNNS